MVIEKLQSKVGNYITSGDLARAIFESASKSRSRAPKFNYNSGDLLDVSWNGAKYSRVNGILKIAKHV